MYGCMGGWIDGWVQPLHWVDKLRDECVNGWMNK